MDTVFRSADVPAEQRFDQWYETARRAYAPHEVHTDHLDDFTATLGVLDLGPARLSVLTCPPLAVRRTPKLIREFDPEVYHLSVTLRGRLGLAQAGREVEVGEGDLVLSDSSRPYDGWARAEDSVAMVGLQFPRTLLPLPEDEVGTLTATRLSGRDGIGALVTTFLTHLAGDADRYRPADTARLSSVALDLVTTLLARQLDAADATPPEGHARALLLRIQSYVHRHLDDPRLTPDALAAAHHISTRYLHRLFQREGHTVAAWVRQRRLDRCRRDLGDPRLGARPIHSIAARWGFAHPADFSRAFRAAYGIPPREFRRRALQALYTERKGVCAHR